MLGNENIASKPRAGRASPPCCHFLHHLLVLKTRLLKMVGLLAACVFDALLCVDSAGKRKQKRSFHSCFQNCPERM